MSTSGSTPPTATPRRPAISHAILVHNRGRRDRLADGIVVTPSHNPPEDGGFKYNPPNGGPADTDVTGWIQAEANRLLEADLAGVRRIALADAAASTTPYDFVGTYVADLATVIDMDAIRSSGLRIGVDPLGGASVAYWPAIGERYGLDLTVTNDTVDPQFAFMTCDWDGRIRMDPSSPHAMARLVALKDRFDVALGNDTDADRHGIVTPGAGLLNPNHFLAVAVGHLFGGGRDWGADVAVGKTLVSSAMIDRVTADLGRRLLEVPVGFKWFVDGLVDGSLGFGGEESAGASFLRRDGTVWTTDKDGIIACLLAAEITARDGRDPGVAYAGPDRPVRGARLSPDRRAGHPRPEGHPGPPVPRGCLGHPARRRSGHRHPHDRPRQRRPDRRAQGHDRPGLVRGPPVRDRERLQDLRRELPWRGPSRADHRGGASGRRAVAGRLIAPIRFRAVLQ